VGGDGRGGLERWGALLISGRQDLNFWVMAETAGGDGSASWELVQAAVKVVGDGVGQVVRAGDGARGRFRLGGAIRKVLTRSAVLTVLRVRANSARGAASSGYGCGAGLRGRCACVWLRSRALALALACMLTSSSYSRSRAQLRADAYRDGADGGCRVADAIRNVLTRSAVHRL
jgi:hypothetical protein